jgi:hypothetical protein
MPVNVRTVTGVLLILIGVAGLYLGVIGWNEKRELVDTSVIEVAMTERETSPLLAALGGIALVTGLFTLWSGRDRSPV